MTNHTKDTNGIVYEPHPSIGVYNTILAEKLKHDANYETVVSEVNMHTKYWTVDNLFWHYNNGLVSSLSPSISFFLPLKRGIGGEFKRLLERLLAALLLS